MLLGFIISITIIGTYIEYKIRKEYEEQCSKSKEDSSDNASSDNAYSSNADININCFIDNK
mgnify:CR=1 FL=1